MSTSTIELTYTAPASDNNDASVPSHSVDMLVSYDTDSYDIDSNTYLATKVGGTYKTLDNEGNITKINDIVGLSAPNTLGENDNRIRVDGNTPFVTNQGIAFKISDASGTLNSNKGIVNFYSENGFAARSENPTTDQFYQYFERNIGFTNQPTETDVVCFASGTRIRTARGDVAVEDLAIGDLAVTASGEHRPIRWIGHRTLDPRRHADPALAQPIRIHAGAFGENKPARDLRVSPGHAIALDLMGEVLIPASALVNGSTIVQEDVESVTYWHVELDSHDLLVAEGLAAESYLDMGNRPFFGDLPAIGLAASPDADPAMRTHADFCRPFHAAGPVVAAVRAQLRHRAEAQGFRLAAPETWAGVYLDVDGVRVAPKTRGLSACFLLPAGAQDMWLVSPTGRPCAVEDSADGRGLGLCLSGLSLDDGLGEARGPVALDDPRLAAGFHGVEGGHRWTAGRARLATGLLDGLEGVVFLRLDLARPPLPRWSVPEAVETKGVADANSTAPAVIAA